jgi:kynureninase
MLCDLNAHFAAVREQFPSLESRACLAAHSFGPCPRGTFTDLEAYKETLLQRPLLFDYWLERLSEMYGLFEQLIGAPPGTVALRESASGCHATVLSALEPRPNRARLVASRMQFPSISYMVSAQQRRGFDVDFVSSADGVHLDADSLIARLDEKVAAVFVPVVASFNGALLDIRRVVEAANDVGAIPVLDAYAALGVVELDVSSLPPCVVIGGTVKWLGGGGTGLAFMHVHPDLVERLPPAYPGWLGDARFFEFSPDFAPAVGARRYQMGTPAMEPVYTARAGLRFVLEQGLGRLQKRNAQLLDLLATRATELGLEVKSPLESQLRAGIVSIEVDDSEHTVASLRKQGFDIDSRGAGAVRLGPHWCITPEECERAIALIADSRR